MFYWVDGANWYPEDLSQVHGVKEVKLHLLLDGDTKSYSSIVKEQPYGPNTQIEKLECVGHIHKFN